MTVNPGDWIWAGGPRHVLEVKDVPVTVRGRKETRPLAQTDKGSVYVNDATRLCTPEEIDAAKLVNALSENGKPSCVDFFTGGWKGYVGDDGMELTRPDGLVLEISVEGGTCEYEAYLVACVRVGHVRVPLYL